MTTKSISRVLVLLLLTVGCQDATAPAPPLTGVYTLRNVLDNGCMRLADKTCAANSVVSSPLPAVITRNGASWSLYAIIDTLTLSPNGSYIESGLGYVVNSLQPPPYLVQLSDSGMYATSADTVVLASSSGLYRYLHHGNTLVEVGAPYLTKVYVQE